MTRDEKQILLDRLTTRARHTADNCGAAARLHAVGEMIDDKQVEKIAREIEDELRALEGFISELGK